MEHVSVGGEKHRGWGQLLQLETNITGLVRVTCELFLSPSSLAGRRKVLQDTSTSSGITRYNFAPI